MRMKPTLEINPAHPIIDSLRSKFVQNKNSKETQDFAKLLYDVAAMAGTMIVCFLMLLIQRAFIRIKGGYNIEDPNALAVRIMGLMDDGEILRGADKSKPEPAAETDNSKGGKGPDDGGVDVVDAEVVS